MSIQLTPSQQSAVDNEGGGLLVSAAAGSGKTRVLVERLFRHVLGEEQCHVDDFLIITYTRAAAAELRSRIAQELTERFAQSPGDRHLQQQLLRVYQADIKTIDSFCTGLLRENIHLLDTGSGRSLTADFRVLDENEAMRLRRRVLPRVLENFYDQLTEGGALLAGGFGFGRDDRNLEELVLTLYDKIQSHAYPERWLERQRDVWRETPGDAGETVYGRLILERLGRKARHWSAQLLAGVREAAWDANISKCYGPGFRSAAAQLAALEEACAAGWDAAAACQLVYPRLTPVRRCENPELKRRLQSQWNRCKKEMAAAQGVLSATADQAGADLAGIAPAMEALLTLCGQFASAYSQEKLRRNVTDFSDQEHYAVRLLLGEEGTPTELARQVAARYREVMVDEYQDTNEVQNAIFSAVSREGRNLFTVGDVKQSIYRFRLADPTIFLEKYRRYPHAGEAADGEPRKILLSQNFRSRRPVLDATNFVFRNILSREMGEMDYGDEEQLHFGADYLPERTDCGTEFHLLDLPAGRGEDELPISRPLAEARFVAERIRELLDSGFPVTDEDTHGLRPCRMEDMVVLMRSPGPRLRHYARALEEQGIACATQEREDFFSTMEVAVVYALLQILDNPRQDVPLIAVLRSPLFGFTPDKLAILRGRHPAGDFYEALAASRDPVCRTFLERLAVLRSHAKDMCVHRLVWHLYNELNVLGVFGAMDGGDQRRENLIALYEHARAFESAGYKGLFSFVSHLRFLLENGEQPPTASGSVSGGVRIMSIHKSKGLEFPIVFLADLNKDFNKMDFQAPVLVHPQLGLGPMYVDLERHIRYPTVARQAIEGQLSREMRAEEMRVLYVGMTRAKEKLILVASMQNAPRRLAELAALSALPVPPETVDGARSMAEWVLLPLLERREAAPLRAAADMEEGICAAEDDSSWTVGYHDGLSCAHPVFQGGAPERPPVETADFDPAVLDYRYPYQPECRLPTKLTATQLKGREKDQEIAENTVQPYRRTSFDRPLFLAGERPLTADQRGTATHLVMQYLPLDGDVAKTLADLTRRRLLTEEQAAAVDASSIRRFLASPLAAQLRQAERVEREYRFSLLVPAADYYPQASGSDQVLLQGVVDLFAETAEGLVVVDFKTDYVTAETLEERTQFYRPQLTAYSAALERILEKPVIRRVLYFFRTGQTVEV